MNGSADDDAAAREFLSTLGVGDICSGTVSDFTRRHEVSVILDGFPARALGRVFSSDRSWGRSSAVAPPEAGQRITAEVIGIDLETCRARLAITAAENPELWAFLKGRRQGETLTGTIASIERFGVFVAAATLARLGARLLTSLNVRIAPRESTVRRIVSTVCPGGLADLTGEAPAGQNRWPRTAERPRLPPRSDPGRAPARGHRGRQPDRHPVEGAGQDE